MHLFYLTLENVSFFFLATFIKINIFIKVLPKLNSFCEN